MKVIIFFTLFLSWTGFSQVDTTHLHFFKDKTISTVVYYSQWDGKAIAYNKKGEIIYENGVRNFAGHASVYFSHYPSGAVKSAHYSSAPDAGIQWYKSDTQFDEEGNVTSYYEQSQEDLMRPSFHTEPTQSSTISIYNHRTKFVNSTHYLILCTVTEGQKSKEVMLKPGEFYLGPQFNVRDSIIKLSEKVTYKVEVPNVKRKLKLKEDYQLIDLGKGVLVHTIEITKRR